MFIIIGGDGKEYGPATAEQLRQWITAGRANLETKAKALGTDEWRRLGDFAEFAPPDGLPPMMDGAAPVAPAATPAGVPVAVADLGDRGARLGARLIDWIISFIAVLPGCLMLGPEFIRMVREGMQGHQPDFEQMDIARLGAGALVCFAGWLVVLIIQIVLLSMRGQSIGKVCTGLRIVRVADGSQAGFVHAWLLRECFISVIGVLISFLPFIGPVFLRPVFHLTDWCMIFRDDRRCLHDLIAGTRVVKK